MNYLGIDIGGTAVKIGIVDDQGNVTCFNDYEVAFDGYKTPILETVLKSTDIFIEDYGIDIGDIAGIGISATGQIDTAKGVVAGVCGNIINWQGAELKKSFEEKYNKNVTVVNDANCAAIGEQWIGGAKGYDNAIIITVGTGIGGGIIVNSQILLGSIGIAGEIGHFTIRKEGRRCTCGNVGCYEQYASMTALVRQVTEMMEKENITDIPKVNGKVIFDKVRLGDERFIQCVDAWMDDIAAGLVGLVHIFNPDIIVIGGGVSVQKELFIDKVREKVLSGVMPRFGENLKVEAAALGNYAGLIGAVRYYMQKF